MKAWNLARCANIYATLRFKSYSPCAPSVGLLSWKCFAREKNRGLLLQFSLRANISLRSQNQRSEGEHRALARTTTLSRLEVRVLLCELPIHCAQVMSYLEHLASPRSKAKASCMSISYLVSPELMPSKASSPAVVPCPICNRTVPMGIINNHIDNGCPPPKASDLEAALPPSSKNKGKQKQEWTKLFQGGGDGAVISGPKTGKGKSRYECRSFRSVAGLC